MTEHIDYHIHINDFNKAKALIFNLHHEQIKENKTCKISISNHDNMFIYQHFPLIDYAKRYNIKLVPSFSIVSEEGIELLIDEPKYQSKELLNLLKNQREDELYHILFNLSDNNLSLDIDNILESNNLQEIFMIELEHIVNELLEEGYFNNRNIAISHLKLALVPKIKYSIEELLTTLSDENIYIVNANKQHETLLNKKNIMGAISNKNNSWLMKSLYRNEKQFKFGSGNVI